MTELNQENLTSNQTSRLLVKLLQGFVYSTDKKHWEILLTRQQHVRLYFKQLGLNLHLDQEDGYAFLKSVPSVGELSEGMDESVDNDEKSEDSLSLVRRMPLSFEVTLLCVLLRENIEQYDVGVSDDHRLILSKTDIYTQLKLFFPASNDEVKQAKKFDSYIQKVSDLGFLKPLGTENIRFEVRRTIKALIDAEKLGEIKAAMLKDLGLNSDQTSGESHH